MPQLQKLTRKFTKASFRRLVSEHENPASWSGFSLQNFLESPGVLSLLFVGEALLRNLFITQGFGLIR